MILTHQPRSADRPVLPRAVRHWTLTTLREKLIKIGAKVVSHAWYVPFQMAKVAVPREVFKAILGRTIVLWWRGEVHPGKVVLDQGELAASGSQETIKTAEHSH